MLRALLSKLCRRRSNGVVDRRIAMQLRRAYANHTVALDCVDAMAIQLAEIRALPEALPRRRLPPRR